MGRKKAVSVLFTQKKYFILVPFLFKNFFTKIESYHLSAIFATADILYFSSNLVNFSRLSFLFLMVEWRKLIFQCQIFMESVKALSDFKNKVDPELKAYLDKAITEAGSKDLFIADS